MFHKPSTAVNVITAVVAVFLSLLLLLVVPFTTIYSVAVDSITPQSISKMTRATIDTMVENADFEQMILDNAAVKDNIEKLGIPAETIGQLMKSGAANEVIDLLAADMSNLLAADTAEMRTTPEALVSIIKEHADELAQIAVDMTGETDKKEQLKADIIAAVEADAESFTVVLPNMEQLRETISAQLPLEQIARLLNPTALWISIGVCLLLAGLIYSCRTYHFGGFLWLGIDGVLCAAGVGLAVKALQWLSNTLLASAGESADILDGMLTYIINSLNVRTWILLGVSVAFIVGYILLHYLVVKKHADTPSPAPVATTQE